MFFETKNIVFVPKNMLSMQKNIDFVLKTFVFETMPMISACENIGEAAEIMFSGIKKIVCPAKKLS
jgi:hypothetical protein